jgi:hypothetical protein
MKSGAKTESEFQELTGGGVMVRPLQILGVKTLKFQAAMRTHNQTQIGWWAGQSRYFHSECLFAGRAT